MRTSHQTNSRCLATVGVAMYRPEIEPRLAPRGARHDFAVDISEIQDAPGRQAEDPVAVPRAVDIGAFRAAPVREAEDPVAGLLAVDKGAFLDGPVREAEDPVAGPSAVLETSGTRLRISIRDPRERSRSLGQATHTFARPGHACARRETRIPDVAPWLLGTLHPARRAGRLAGARLIGVEPSPPPAGRDVPETRDPDAGTDAPETREPEVGILVLPTRDPAGALDDPPAAARSAACRFCASVRKTPFGNCCRYASKSAGFVLFMTDCQNRLSSSAVGNSNRTDWATPSPAGP